MDTFEVNDIRYNITDTLSKEVEVTEGNYRGDIVIPSSVSFENEQYSVTAIGDYALYDCSSLTSITIPNSVTNIGKDAFEWCSSLTSITSLSVTPPECDSNAFRDVDTQNCTLYVPAGSKGAYKQAPGWKEFVNIEELDAILVGKIRLNKAKVDIKNSSTFQLTAEILPTDATYQTLQWKSSNTACVTVDADGLLTAIEQGEATITVRSADGNAEATCLVKVVSTSGVESVKTDTIGVTEVYNMAGVKVASSLENLPEGIYIVRIGSTMRKIQ